MKLWKIERARLKLLQRIKGSPALAAFGIGTILCIMAALIVSVVSLTHLPKDWGWAAIPVLAIGFCFQLYALWKNRPK